MSKTRVSASASAHCCWRCRPAAPPTNSSSACPPPSPGRRPAWAIELYRGSMAWFDEVNQQGRRPRPQDRPQGLRRRLQPHPRHRKHGPPHRTGRRLRPVRLRRHPHRHAHPAAAQAPRQAVVLPLLPLHRRRADAPAALRRIRLQPPRLLPRRNRRPRRSLRRGRPQARSPSSTRSTPTAAAAGTACATALASGTTSTSPARPPTAAAPPSTASMQEQVDILRKGDPDAVICVGAYAACAAFVRDARDAGWDVPIANVSFVGSEILLALLDEGGRRLRQGLHARPDQLAGRAQPYRDSTCPASRRTAT